MSTEEEIQRIINDITNGILTVPTHNAIARLLELVNQFRFKTASIDSNIWYEFKSHRWVNIPDTYVMVNDKTIQCGGPSGKSIKLDYPEMLTKLVRELDKLFENKRKILCEKLVQLSISSIDTMKDIFKNISHITDIVSILHQDSFTNDVLSEYKKIVYDPDFSKKVNTDTNLICFENGVYDLTENILRDGQPVDYISIQMPYPYREYEPNNKSVNEITDYLNKLFPDPDLLRYVCSRFLRQLDEKEKKYLYVFHGKITDGKSKFADLIRASFGNHCVSFDSSAIRCVAEKQFETEREIRIRILDDEMPNLVDKNNNIYVSTRDNEEINSSFLKSNSDAKSFLFCDKLPIIDENTWKQLKVIPVNSEFIYDNLSEEVEKFRESFMSILVKYYKEYVENGVKVPQIVEQYTAQYNCNLYRNFIADTLEETDDLSNTITLSIIFNLFKTWYASNYKYKCPTRMEFIQYLKKFNRYDSKYHMLNRYVVKKSAQVQKNELDFIKQCALNTKLPDENNHNTQIKVEESKIPVEPKRMRREYGFSKYSLLNTTNSIKSREMQLTFCLRKYGYSTKLSAIKRHSTLMKMFMTVGGSTTLRHLNITKNYNDRPHIKKILREDIDFLKDIITKSELKGTPVITTPKIEQEFHFKQYGYSTTLSKELRHNILMQASVDVGELKVLRRLNLARNYNINPSTRKIFEEDVEFLKSMLKKSESNETSVTTPAKTSLELIIDDMKVNGISKIQIKKDKISVTYLYPK